MAGPENRCPKCGSNQIQSVEAAYIQSIRVGGNGFTISEFGMRLAPPEPESTFGVPAVSGLSVYGFFLCFAWYELDAPITVAPWVLVEHGFGGFATIALLASMACALVISAGARLYNRSKLPGLIRAWKTDRVCRACLHRFPGPKPNGDR